MSSVNYFLDKQRERKVNILNYYYFPNLFSPEEVNKIIETGEKFEKKVAKTNGEVISNYRISEIAWLDNNEESDWIYQKISECADIANKEVWNFDIWGLGDPIQYTKYNHENNGHYDWHVDLGIGNSNRKLSCVVQLTDPKEYEGGDLQMNTGGNIITVPKGLGTICFFPSFLLHKVTPMTSGQRKSLVSWFSGTNFR
jgi:PKHD-type hydroxylase